MAELVVSIGILLLMLSLAGQVFNLTIRSTGQATALTEVGQLLRAFERAIREDLRHVQPGQSLILIQGNPVNAYWTQEGSEADDDGEPFNGYPHVSDPGREKEDASGDMIMVSPRADILMFFTARKATSFVHPRVTSSLQQVVYGHAVLGEYAPSAVPGDDPAPGPEAFPVDPATDYPSTTLVSQVPAARWHLARRGVLLMSTPPPPDATPWAEALTNAARKLTDAFDNPRIFRGETDVIGNFRFEEWVLTPGEDAPWYLPAIFNNDMTPHARSLLDPTPPPTLAERLGHYFLPNCASFKVEWTLAPRSEFVAGRLEGMREVLWFDPGDPEHPLGELEAVARPVHGDPPPNLKSLLDDRTNHPDGNGDPVYAYSLAERFRGPTLEEINPADALWPVLAPDERPNLIVFGPARRNLATGEVVPEDIFPSALRITVDVFDRERRLDRPTRHVMVVPVGG